MMYDLMKKQPYDQTASQVASIGDSHDQMPKMKRKVRIVHIFAPEIIKTDVENFRELVQRLTGNHAKTTSADRRRKKKKRKMMMMMMAVPAAAAAGHSTEDAGSRMHGCTAPASTGAVKVEAHEEEILLRPMEEEKNQEYLWLRQEEEDLGSFLSALGGVDVVFEGLDDILHPLMLPTMNSSHMDAIDRRSSSKCFPNG